jgi:hypothetical protein
VYPLSLRERVAERDAIGQLADFISLILVFSLLGFMQPGLPGLQVVWYEYDL